MRTLGITVGWLAALLVALVLGPVSPGIAATVPVDVFGELGDEHIAFPPYQSATYSSPTASVGTLGDIDGDGREDSAIVLDSYEPLYPSSVWVTFSASVLPSATAAGTPPWRGFRVVGSRLNSPVTGLGDINGDGLREVAVQGGQAGGVAVVFGRTDSMTVDLDDLGDDGFHISGAGSNGEIGFGDIYSGLAWQNTSMVSAGDQNGDGREDLAVVSGRAVKVVYSPPDPAGKEVSAIDLGSGGFTLTTTETPNQAGPFVGRLGDLNRDGREDLLVSWDDRETQAGYAAGVISPGPGDTEDLRTVAERGTGFELRAHDSYLENGIAIGDQNDDGRRDALLVAVDFDGRGRQGIIGYSPPLGVERDIYNPAVAEGVLLDVYNGNVIDVGDQDGDGRADLAFSNVVSLSSADGRTRPVGPVNPAGLGGALYLLGSPIIVGSLADRNGDGRREIVAVHANPYADDSDRHDHRATYMLDVFGSAPLPLPVTVDLPVQTDDAVEFAGDFATAPDGGSRTLGARAAVELTRPDGTVERLLSPEIVDANGERTRAAVRVRASDAGLVPGRTYRYRLLLENGRGLVGAAQVRSFTFGEPEAQPSPEPASTPTPEPASTPTPEPASTPTPEPAGTPTPAPSAEPSATATPSPEPSVTATPSPGAQPSPGAKPSPSGPTPFAVAQPGPRSADRGPAPRPAIRLLTGTSGANLIAGTSGRDRILGGRGADRLRGGRGADRLSGGPGADRLVGGPGRDVLLGGAGPDRLDARDGERDDVRCGSGRDVARVDHRDRVRGCERVRRRSAPTG